MIVTKELLILTRGEAVALRDALDALADDGGGPNKKYTRLREVKAMDFHNAVHAMTADERE